MKLTGRIVNAILGANPVVILAVGGSALAAATGLLVWTYVVEAYVWIWTCLTSLVGWWF